MILMSSETKILVDIVSKVSGETVDAIMSGGRRRPLPTCRWLVARELMRRGYSSAYSSREMGLDHATLLHGKKMLEVMERDPRNGYAEELQIAVAFTSALESSKMV